MARKIRSTNTFSLSFLDIMSCGLGAAVLIFLLLRHQMDSPITPLDPRDISEVNLLEEEIKVGEKNLARIRNTISQVSDETVVAQGLARKISEEIKQLKSLLEEIAPDSSLDVPGLKAKIARLEAQKKALENTVPTGNKAYEFTGDGQRQYLTGIQLGGENVLILLDASASMLDETIVNIIRRRNMPDDAKRLAPKWQRATSVAQWVIANLPLNADFQVWGFNDQIKPAFGNDINQWYEVGDKIALSKAVKGVRSIVPVNGTNLEQVLLAAMDMRPRPDNIFLITDGLPTQGSKASKNRNISGTERYRLFTRAVNNLLPNIPVNTMLLPLEGDPYAAAAFWRLAITSRGSFVTPARDWP